MGAPALAPQAVVEEVAESIDLTAVRGYRMALARSAAARPRPTLMGRTAGRVVVRLSTIAAGMPPVLGIAQSSNDVAMDGAAMEIVGRAVQVTALPESLRDRRFSIEIVLEFGSTAEP